MTIGKDASASGFSIPECSIFEQLQKSASKYPDRTALVFFGRRITYSELLSRIMECALAMTAAGVEKGDTVTISLPNCPQAVYSFYASNMIGAVAHMLHPLSGEAEIQDNCLAAGSKIAIILDSIKDRFDTVQYKIGFSSIIVCDISSELPAAKRVLYRLKNKPPKVAQDGLHLSWTDFLERGSAVEKIPEAVVKGPEAALILNTGGSTGSPKGALISNSSFNALALQLRSLVESEEGLKMITLMPLFHGFGLATSLHTPLTFGLTCFLMPRFDAKQYCRMWLRNKVNMHVGTPQLFETLLSSKMMAGKDLSFMTGMFIGGDDLTPEKENRITEMLREHGARITPSRGYGLTEAVNAVTAAGYTFCTPGSIGAPLPGNLVKIVKVGTTNEADASESGEICVSGPTVMMGYVGRPEENDETLRRHDDGRIWLHTGDLGYIDGNGDLFFQQRLKRIIVSNGYNIYPTQVEGVFEAHAKVDSCCAVGIPDARKGEAIKVFIVLKAGYKPSADVEKEFRAYARRQLARFSQPAVYEFRDSLPLTKVGKVDSRRLQAESVCAMTADDATPSAGSQ